MRPSPTVLKKRSGRNGKIELLRFIFALCILIFHINKRLFQINGIHAGGIYFFTHGCFGVEFFFLVSGYLLGKKAYDMRTHDNPNLGSETYRVIKKKILSVFPMAFYSTFITLIVNLIAKFNTAEERIEYLVRSWPSFLLLNLFGFETSWVNKLTWYLCAYLMSSAILYPLARRYYSMFTYIVCPMGALFILGWLDHTYGLLCRSSYWTGYFYVSFLRGLSEMALGIFAFHLTRYLNRMKLSSTTKKILSFIEPLGYALVLLYINLKFSYHDEFPMLFFTMFLMILSFSDINPMKETFNRPIIFWLGKISLPLYLNQFYVIRLVTWLMGNSKNYALTITLIIVFCFAAAILSDILINLFMNTIKAKRSRND